MADSFIEVSSDFVPASFVVPTEFVGSGFRLVPLAEEHNDRDYAAWTSSADHIRATPGFEGRAWPCERTLEENLIDLRQHAKDFANRNGFTYTVIDSGNDVIGCVYVYPAGESSVSASVRSWVRADLAYLDAALYRSVCGWLVDAWPFTTVDYAAR